LSVEAKWIKKRNIIFWRSVPEYMVNGGTVEQMKFVCHLTVLGPGNGIAAETIVPHLPSILNLDMLFICSGIRIYPVWMEYPLFWSCTVPLAMAMPGVGYSLKLPVLNLTLRCDLVLKREVDISGFGVMALPYVSLIF
jgi:hypothetical protein